jgi:hypothetical protein
VELQGGRCTCIWASAGMIGREARWWGGCPRPVRAGGCRRLDAVAAAVRRRQDPRQMTGSGQWDRSSLAVIGD